MLRLLALTLRFSSRNTFPFHGTTLFLTGLSLQFIRLDCLIDLRKYLAMSKQLALASAQFEWDEEEEEEEDDVVPVGATTTKSQQPLPLARKRPTVGTGVAFVRHEMMHNNQPDLMIKSSNARD